MIPVKIPLGGKSREKFPDVERDPCDCDLPRKCQRMRQRMRTCVSIVHERRTHIIHGQLLLYELINRQHLSVFVLRSGGAIMRSDGIRVDVKARIAPDDGQRIVDGGRKGAVVTLREGSGEASAFEPADSVAERV